jgi:hypothetical protein
MKTGATEERVKIGDDTSQFSVFEVKEVDKMFSSCNRGPVRGSNLCPAEGDSSQSNRDENTADGEVPSLVASALRVKNHTKIIQAKITILPRVQ